VLPLLSPAYRALAPDQRGHGDSDKPECCYAADDFAADVDAFMDAVGIEGATLVGDSSGDLIAQRVALSYPPRVSRLVLIGAPTLILWGERDAVLPRQEQERRAAAIPNATLRVYPDTGHLVHWERPEWVVRDLEAFIEETRRA
jgi:pimeloyl-ACP methyl ester carboxylesterase